MDETTREYLDAINKIADNAKPIEPKMLPVSDEIVWLEITKCLIDNLEISGVNSHDVVLISDWYLKQFKQRFRE